MANSGKASATSSTIITGEPNEFVRQIHTRMPIILPGEHHDAWFPGAAGKEILAPYPSDRMEAWPISGRVNSPKNDDAEIIAPIELNKGRGWSLIHYFRHPALMEENSSRSLASSIFSRSDSKTQTQYLTKSTPPNEFNLQPNVALLVDFFQA